MERKDLFYQTYAGLPILVRKEIVLTMEETDGPITWEAAYREIKEDTEIGKEILKRLVELGFIKTDDEYSK